MTEMINVFIWKERAYLPILGKTEVGFFWDTDRLVTAKLTVESLTSALEEVIEIGNPPIRHPAQKEFQKPTPVQKALGMNDWKKMARAGVICAVVYWAQGKIGVAFSARNASDIQEIDYTHQQQFPLDASPRELAEFILQEVSRRNSTRHDYGRKE
jgi:hypothetical protein